MDEMLKAIIGLCPLLVAVGASIKKVIGTVFFQDTTIEYTLKSKSEKLKERLYSIVILFLIVCFLNLMSYKIVSNALKVCGISENVFLVIEFTSVVILIALYVVCLVVKLLLREKKHVVKDILAYAILVLNVLASIEYNYEKISLDKVVFSFLLAYITTIIFVWCLFVWQNVDKAVTFFYEEGNKKKYIYHGFKEKYCIIGDSEEMSENTTIYEIDDLSCKEIHICKKNGEEQTKVDDLEILQEIVKVHKDELVALEKMINKNK